MNDCLAIIPARGGSKRIPKKNIKFFCGKPIIYYSIKAALTSNCFDKVIVSTDDKTTAKIALNYGAEVPFKRPKKLSNDKATTSEVINHSINFYKNKGINFNYVCCIYPTAPFLSKSNLIKGYNLIKQKKYDFVLTVTEYSHPIQRSFKILKKGGLKIQNPKLMSKPTNNFEKIYHDAGKFYFGKCKSFLKKKLFFGKNSYPIILNKSVAQDINDIEDWKIAESIFKNINIRF